MGVGASDVAVEQKQIHRICTNVELEHGVIRLLAELSIHEVVEGSEEFILTTSKSSSAKVLQN